MGTLLKRVYFVRHGESDANARGLLQGPLGNLTAQGRMQAEATAKRVARLEIEVVVASTYERAQETAAIIASHNDLPLAPSELFVERLRPSELVGYHKDDPYVEQVNSMLREHYTDPNWRYQDAENFFDLKQRIKDAVEFLEKRTASTLLVVTHGTFLRGVAGHLLHGDSFSPDMMLHYAAHLRTTNTGITYCELKTNDAGETYWTLVSWNDQAHL